MDADFNKNIDDSLLSEDFDIEDLPLYRRRENYEDDDSDYDSADMFDIFPKMLSGESQFYPKSWR